MLWKILVLVPDAHDQHSGRRTLLLRSISLYGYRTFPYSKSIPRILSHLSVLRELPAAQGTGRVFIHYPLPLPVEP